MFKYRTLLFILFFILLGAAAHYLLWNTEDNSVFIILLSPVLTISDFIPNQINHLFQLPPEQSKLISDFPYTLVFTLFYFGLTGYWLRQICKENGFLKYFLLISFLGFLVIVHWQSFEYVQNILYAQSGTNN